MQITDRTWKAYITELEKLNKTAFEEMLKFVNRIGGWYRHQNEVIEYAYALATKYGEGAATLSALMYDATAAMQGANVPPAIPAKTATLREVTDYMYRVANFSEETIPNGVARLVKQAGADTTLQNARRDGAQFAWIPQGDTCAFCLTLASNGWRNASKRVMQGDHAKHIHSNCNCEFAVRFSEKDGVQGYNPDKYKKLYYNAEGNTSKEKINSLRRELYAKNKNIVGTKSGKAEEFIVSIDDRFDEKAKNKLSLLNKLVNEYKSPLREVEKGGSTSAGEKGFVGIGTRHKMNLSSTAEDTVIHEFAHTLAIKKEDNFELSNNQDFWKEIAKVRREYNKETSRAQNKRISAYADTSIDEFMAEAFTLAKLKELGYPITIQTGLNEDALPYAQKVYAVINKYFKR